MCQLPPSSQQETQNSDCFGHLWEAGFLLSARAGEIFTKRKGSPNIYLYYTPKQCSLPWLPHTSTDFWTTSCFPASRIPPMGMGPKSCSIVDKLVEPVESSLLKKSEAVGSLHTDTSSQMPCQCSQMPYYHILLDNWRRQNVAQICIIYYILVF